LHANGGSFHVAQAAMRFDAHLREQVRTYGGTIVTERRRVEPDGRVVIKREVRRFKPTTKTRAPRCTAPRRSVAVVSRPRERRASSSSRTSGTDPGSDSDGSEPPPRRLNVRPRGPAPHQLRDVGVPAIKQTVTLDFTELPSQPVNGVTINGLTFGFTGGDATYNAFGPGATVFVQDPSIEGSTSGTLTLAFARPTNVLEFGLALSAFGTLSPGATVTLYNPGGKVRQVVPLRTESLVSFTEARFAYSGGAIGSATVTFNATAAARFALDNLTFQQKGVPAAGSFSASPGAVAAAWSP
jgi:hypothetical protein